MDKRFRIAVELTLNHEGGLVEHPNDPGGLTNFGISQRTYPDIDIRNLTREGAARIYYEDWWKRHRYHDIKSLPVAAKVFDTSINTGPAAAHRMLQRALRQVGFDHVAIDGVLGPQTFGATNQAEPEALLEAFIKMQKNYYRSIIQNNPDLAVFRNGWMNRANAKMEVSESVIDILRKVFVFKLLNEVFPMQLDWESEWEKLPDWVQDQRNVILAEFDKIIEGAK